MISVMEEMYLVSFPMKSKKKPESNDSGFF